MEKRLRNYREEQDDNAEDLTTKILEWEGRQEYEIEEIVHGVLEEYRGLITQISKG